jgi:Holliday junction resolvase RusA-like endonuclease
LPAPATSLTAHRLSVVIYGTPAPQGSKRHVGHGIMVDHNAASLHTWREDVKLAALRAMEETPGWERDYPAIAAHIAFTLSRPQSHYRTGKFAHLLRDNAPNLHGTRPDLDKLLRSTWDALTAAGAYRDDCRIAQVYAVKTYPAHTGNPTALDKPGARIVLSGVAS